MFCNKTHTLDLCPAVGEDFNLYKGKQVILKTAKLIWKIDVLYLVICPVSSTFLGSLEPVNFTVENSQSSMLKTQLEVTQLKSNAGAQKAVQYILGNIPSNVKGQNV